MKTTIGGDRLGSGHKQETSLKNYSRSTHDLKYIWRSSMSSGTLVPFMSEVGLPGDNFDIELDANVLTLPTIGPLYGSYKVQLDVFTCPIRLYNGKLHMNMLGIGMDMDKIKLPQIAMEAIKHPDKRDDNEQINPSCIFSYLNIRGLGINPDETLVKREFNAVPYLAYWDIYKNYYANKQEERGMVISSPLKFDNDYNIKTAEIVEATVQVPGTDTDFPTTLTNILAPTEAITDIDGKGVLGQIIIYLKDGTGIPQKEDIKLRYKPTGETRSNRYDLIEFYEHYEWVEVDKKMVFSGLKRDLKGTISIYDQTVKTEDPPLLAPPVLQEFPLDNIDQMRMDILKNVENDILRINQGSIAPYGLALDKIMRDENDPETWIYKKQSSQEGLGIKTYQSDLFNNWITTEWIDGTNGINEITSVNTESGSFTIDSLNLANKVYNMLNRIALSGGTYDDWLDAVYTHDRAKSVENPVYQGSLIKELAFQEVVSNSDTEVKGETQPLGTLAGRGKLTPKNKGGKMKIKIDEPSYIMGIVSITPRIDYSQGNKWDVNLKTLDDFHKPALDEIGFQDLITDQMAWFDTIVPTGETPTFKSAGKQPAWINYMTNVNQVRGNFAIQDNQMYMVLNRRYEQGDDEEGILDLTTYIDPTKFNHIFADTTLDAQNFWVQISNDIKARRKMSAKIIPNL